MSAEASIVLVREDRLAALFAPIGGASRVTLAMLAGSAALHLAIVATAAVASRAPIVIPAQQETSVEVVQEVPKATPEVAKATTSEKMAIPKETPKPRPPPEVPKAEAVKPETPQSPMKETAMKRTETAAVPNVEAPVGGVAKTEAPKESRTTDDREALVKELAELRAQKAELNATATPEAPPADQGTGPLPSTFQAVALPSSTDGVGEAMAYQDIVFSELAKAKGLGRRQGVPGTAGVRFDIDAAGGLVDAEIVHPSGVAALDAEALNIVHRAAPFPPPPAGAQRSFTANVAFVVRGAP